MENSTKSGGIGCLGMIGIVLIILKLLAIEPVAHWSWIWVLCPYWGPIVLIVFLAILAVFISNGR